jgi:hypothetical protein
MLPHVDLVVLAIYCHGFDLLGVCSFTLFFQIRVSEELRGKKIWFLVGGFGGDRSGFRWKIPFLCQFSSCGVPSCARPVLDTLISSSVLVFFIRFCSACRLQIAKQANIFFDKLMQM